MSAPRRGVVLVLTIVALVFALCPSAVVALDHAGDVSGTWRVTDSPHVVTADVRVPAGQSLVVEAGCRVFFERGTRMEATGRLRAVGTDTAPIWFLSADPDPRPGDWTGLVLSGVGPHELTTAGIEHARTGVRVSTGSDARVSASRFAHCSEAGLAFDAGSLGEITGSRILHVAGTGIRAEDASPAVTDCAFVGNGEALRLVGNAFPFMEGLTARFHLRHDGAVLDGSQPIDRSGAWWDAGVPYVVEDGQTLSVATDAQLLVAHGTEVRFGSGASLSVAGMLMAFGEPTSPCLFTSGNDREPDAFDDTPPLPGDWNGIDVLDGGYVGLLASTVRYADDGVRVRFGGAADVVSSRISHAAARGISFAAGSLGVVEGSSVHDNDIGIEVEDSAAVSISRSAGPAGRGGNNTFSCNVTFHVRNTGLTPLPADANYWTEAPPDPAMLAGPVDATSHLLAEPLESSDSRSVTVERAGSKDLVMSWPEATSCARYRVVTSDRPDMPFSPLSPQTDLSSYVARGHLLTSAPLEFFRVEVDF